MENETFDNRDPSCNYLQTLLIKMTLNFLYSHGASFTTHGWVSFF